MANDQLTILITGASSYAGSRIYFDLKDKYSLIGTYFSNPFSDKFLKLDLSDREAVLKFFVEKKPDIVVHVANFPSPRSAVNNEEKFTKLNENSTEYIVEAANNVDAKVVFISSQAANNPDNIYGKLKVKSEETVKGVKAGYLILRPSLMVGFSPNTTNPRPFNRILSCLDNRSTIGEFDTSWKLQPSYVGHLSQAIDKAIQRDLWNKTIPVFINEVVTQFQLAHDILEPFGVSVKEVDQHMDIPLSPEDLIDMNNLGLTPNTYKEMVELIVDEIKNRNKFVL